MRKKIKALETKYDGYMFRSRLEARWACYFNNMEIEFNYEPQGFDLGGMKYLPDFYLPQLEVWAEVKGGELNDRDYEKAKRLCRETEQPVLLLTGDPALKTYTMLIADEKLRSGVDVYNVNMILSDKTDSGLLVSNFLNGVKDYKAHGEEGLKAYNAYSECRKERFGVFENPLKSLF